jgi:CO dehydrogenase maturation factor
VLRLGAVCGLSPVRVAVAGKGGSGKSVVAGTLARVLARRGETVLALDSDFMPGLALSLGVEEPPEPPLLEAAERDEEGRWRLKRGIGPVRAVQRFATRAPDGVLLLQPGKLSAEGLAPIMPAVQAYYLVVHRLGRAPSLRDVAFVGDLPAGPRQAAFDWAPYAKGYVIVAEPTAASTLTARRVAAIARDRGRDALLVATKVRGRRDVRRVEGAVGLPVVAQVPADEAVREAERLGVAVLDHASASPAVRAVEDLADVLVSRGRGEGEGG